MTRLGREGEGGRAVGKDRLHAHLEGFDLHAAVAVPAGDRARLEHLCRYVLRPPLAQRALARTSDGNVVVRLRRPWRDGTRAIRFEPVEFLEKLAAMIPKPRVNLLIYHGAFAPRAHRRADAVRQALTGAVVRPSCKPSEVAGATAASEADMAGEADRRPDSEDSQASEGSAGATSAAPPRAPPKGGDKRRRYFRWADLLERTFAIDVLACPECGGRLRLLATIEQRSVIERILAHLGLPTELPEPAPARLSQALGDGQARLDWTDD